MLNWLFPKCVHSKYSTECFQTMWGFGMMCGRCKFVKFYKHWPEGYSLQAVPDWSKSPSELLESLTIQQK